MKHMNSIQASYVSRENQGLEPSPTASLHGARQWEDSLETGSKTQNQTLRRGMWALKVVYFLKFYFTLYLLKKQSYKEREREIE